MARINDLVDLYVGGATEPFGEMINVISYDVDCGHTEFGTGPVQVLQA